MRRKYKGLLDSKCLKNGRYAVISSSIVAGSGYPMGVDNLVKEIRSARSDLEQSCAGKGMNGSEVAVELLGPIAFKMIVPIVDHAALPLGTGHERSSGAEDSLNPSSSCDRSLHSNQLLSPTQPSSIEASARAEAEEIARVARQRSISSLSVSEDLVSRVEKEQVSLEVASKAFSGSPDEAVARYGYSRARGPHRSIDFLTEQKTVGGNHKIPAELLSAKVFELQDCEVDTVGQHEELVLHGDPQDGEWNRLHAMYPGVTRVGSCVRGTPAEQLLRYAHIEHVRVTVRVVVQEHPARRNRRLVPLLVRNAKDIIALVRARLESLEEQGNLVDED